MQRVYQTIINTSENERNVKIFPWVFLCFTTGSVSTICCILSQAQSDRPFVAGHSGTKMPCSGMQVTQETHWGKTNKENYHFTRHAGKLSFVCLLPLQHDIFVPSERSAERWIIQVSQDAMWINSI